MTDRCPLKVRAFRLNGQEFAFYLVAKQPVFDVNGQMYDHDRFTGIKFVDREADDLERSKFPQLLKQLDAAARSQQPSAGPFCSPEWRQLLNKQDSPFQPAYATG